MSVFTESFLSAVYTRYFERSRIAKLLQMSIYNWTRKRNYDEIIIDITEVTSEQRSITFRSTGCPKKGETTIFLSF